MNKFNLIQRKGLPISPAKKLSSVFLLFFLLTGISFSYDQNPSGVTATAWYRADALASVFSDDSITQAADNATLQQWNEFTAVSFNLMQPTAASKPIFSMLLPWLTLILLLLLTEAMAGCSLPLLPGFTNLPS